MKQVISVMINDEIQRVVIKKYQITFFNLSTKIIESPLDLSSLYHKYETAMFIEEID